MDRVARRHQFSEELLPVNYDSPKDNVDFSRLDNFAPLHDYKFDVDEMRRAAKMVYSNYKTDPVTDQICFTHTAIDYVNKPNLLYEGCGSLTYQWSETPYDKKGELKKRETKLTDRDFSCFNSQFQDSYFHYIYQKLSENFEIGRFRLMALQPKKCLSWHSDTEDRLHIAIETEPSCRVVIDNECVYIPADGSPYLCKTKKFHSAFNGSHKLRRVHLVVGVHSQS